jgi:hypothetical protein
MNNITSSPRSNVQSPEPKINSKSKSLNLLFNDSTIKQINHVSLPGAFIMRHLTGRILC